MVAPGKSIEGAQLMTKQCRRLAAVLEAHAKAFSLHKADYRLTTALSHDIPTGDPQPVQQQYRHIHPASGIQKSLLIIDLTLVCPSGLFLHISLCLKADQPLPQSNPQKEECGDPLWRLVASFFCKGYFIVKNPSSNMT